jgi:para-nitrobenzyl esterase
MKSAIRKSLGTTGDSAAGYTPGTSAFSLTSCASSPKEKDGEQVLFIGDNIAVASTHYGKVKIFLLRIRRIIKY